MTFSRTFKLVVLVVILQVLEVVEVNAADDPAVGCENGGHYDGTRCECFGNTYGPRCEIVEDPLLIGKNHTATISVDLTVTNFNHSDIITTVAMQKKIEELLKAKEKEMFSFFKDVQIIAFERKDLGLLGVKHDLHITFPFNKDEPVITQYQKLYRVVETELKALNKSKCKEGDQSELCIDGGSVTTTSLNPLSERELCVRSVHVDFVNYFYVVFEDGGLYCKSRCALPKAEKTKQIEPTELTYLNCTKGTCQVKKEGPMCFCPNTDKYLYTYSRCRGPVLIAAMYGGVGASIGVLLIVGIILGVFLYRKKYYE